MQTNDAIEIFTAENGFVVRSASREIGMATSVDDTMVFQSYKEMVIWIGKHFTHRSKEIESDA